jgi:hypothetical protein
VGFSYAASAIMNIRLQQPAEAASDLTWFVEHSAVEGLVGHRESPIPEQGQCPSTTVLNGSVFLPNTFYAEGVGDPTGETPFALAAAVQEFLAGTHGQGSCLGEDCSEVSGGVGGDDEYDGDDDGVIVPFPGFGNGSVHTSISSACFHQLRVAGAFLVSGCFRNASTSFVTVHSEVGQRCRLELPSLLRPLAVMPSSTPMSVSPSGVVELELAAGQTATLYPRGGVAKDLVVRAVEMKHKEANFWGSKAHTNV